MTTPLLLGGRPLAVVNEDGTAIGGGGGGGSTVQYHEGDIPAAPWSVLLCWRDSATGEIRIVQDDQALPTAGGGGGGGGLTDVELRATPVPVSVPGTVELAPATLAALESITATVANWPAVQPVSDNGGSLTVDGTFWQATQPVSGPLTDTQLRAADVPVALNAATLAALESITVVDGGGSLTVDGTFWQATQPVSLAAPVALDAASLAALETIQIGSLPSLPAGANNIGDVDVLTLPALPAGTNNIGDVDVLTLPALPAGTNNIGDVDVVTLPALPAGTNNIGDVDVVSAPALVKGTQQAAGFMGQQFKDAGRNQSNLFMLTPILTTAAEVMMSLTGYKGGAAVVATATPAVVTAGKTWRIQAITLTYIATATAGMARFTIRVNTGGVAVIGSPLAVAHVVGTGTPATAGSSQTEAVPIPEGWELPAGAGIAIGLQGLSVASVGAIAGYGKCTIYGYEY